MILETEYNKMPADVRCQGFAVVNARTACLVQGGSCVEVLANAEAVVLVIAPDAL
jgi:hypothetical protein